MLYSVQLYFDYHADGLRTTPESSPAAIDAFIQRWMHSGAAERANYQLFLSELCDVLDVPRPDPQVADDALNAYVFEKAAPLPHGTTGRIDLYKRGCCVLEAKQGSDAWEGDDQKPRKLDLASSR